MFLALLLEFLMTPLLLKGEGVVSIGLLDVIEGITMLVLSLQGLFLVFSQSSRNLVLDP